MILRRILLVSALRVDIEKENHIHFSKILPIFTNDLLLTMY